MDESDRIFIHKEYPFKYNDTSHVSPQVVRSSELLWNMYIDTQIQRFSKKILGWVGYTHRQ